MSTVFEAAVLSPVKNVVSVPIGGLNFRSMSAPPRQVRFDDSDANTFRIKSKVNENMAIHA